MQVTMFKALKSINIDDTQATTVVEQLEEYVAVKIADATKISKPRTRVSKPRSRDSRHRSAASNG
jgi:hypothetical protein